MSERIPQSVAKRVVFRAYLASDGKTLATGKTIAITISKNGGAFGNPAAGATNATEIASGFYYFDLGTGDAGTTGPLAWRGAEATINDAGDVYEVANAHNAGFDGVGNATAGAANGCVIAGTNAATSFASGSHFIGTVDTLTTYTGNTPQTGDNYARLGAPAGSSLSADIAAVGANAASAASQSSTAAALFVTAMTESYAANGAAPTPAQALFLIQQALTEFAISGTTLTIKKKDHSTTAATLTLDDATNPTSATRAT